MKLLSVPLMGSKQPQQQNLSGVCFTTTWDIAKCAPLLWSSRASSKLGKSKKCNSLLRFLCQLLPLQPITYCCWRAEVLAINSKYMSLRWPFFLLQKYYSFQLSVSAALEALLFILFRADLWRLSRWLHDCSQSNKRKEFWKKQHRKTAFRNGNSKGNYKMNDQCLCSWQHHRWAFGTSTGDWYFWLLHKLCTFKKSLARWNLQSNDLFHPTLKVISWIQNWTTPCETQPFAKVMQSIGSKNQRALFSLIDLQLIIFFFPPRLLKQHFLLPAILTTVQQLHFYPLHNPPKTQHLLTSSGRLKVGAFFLPSLEALRGPPCSEGSFQITLEIFLFVDFSFVSFYTTVYWLADCYDFASCTPCFNADSDSFSLIIDKVP